MVYGFCLLVVVCHFDMKKSNLWHKELHDFPSCANIWCEVSNTAYRRAKNDATKWQGQCTRGGGGVSRQEIISSSA